MDRRSGMGMSDGKVRPCEGCGNPDPWARHPKKEAMTGKVFEECNRCFDPSIPSNPDVYFREPYFDPHLVDFDDPGFVPGKGTWVTCKSHKAFLMKKLGVRENGDFHHGSRNFDPISHRHAEESLKRSPYENQRLKQNDLHRRAGSAI